MIQGEDTVEPFTVQNQDGSPYDLSDRVLRCQIKNPITHEVVLTATVAVAGVATAGAVEVQVPKADKEGIEADTLTYDVFATHPTLGPDKLFKGTITFERAETAA